MIKLLFEYCIQTRKLNNQNFASFANAVAPRDPSTNAPRPGTVLQLRLDNYSSLRLATLMPLLNPTQPSPLFQNVVELSMKKYHQMNSKLLRSLLLATAPTLRKLILTKTPINDDAVLTIAETAPQLEFLDINGELTATNQSFVVLVSRCTNLIHLVRTVSYELVSSVISLLSLTHSLEILRSGNVISRACRSANIFSNSNFVKPTDVLRSARL